MLSLITRKELKKAIQGGSKEVKQVFGTFGINAKTVIFLAEQMGLKTIDAITIFGLQDIWKIAEEPEIHAEGYIYSLEYWFDWLELFEKTE